MRRRGRRVRSVEAEGEGAAGRETRGSHLEKRTAPGVRRRFFCAAGVRIYSGDDSERVDLERNLLARYHDYKETFRRMHELRLERTAEGGF